MSADQRRYRLLSEADKTHVALILAKQYSHFYHVTKPRNLQSIAATGIDPTYESDESRYPGRICEPPDAMRFVLREMIPDGFSAINKGRIVDPSNDTDKPVLLRVPAMSVLGRNFGLEHSHAVVIADVQWNTGAERITAAQFMKVFNKTRSISCYDLIPASEIDLSLIPDVLKGEGPFESLIKPSQASASGPKRP